MCVSRLGPVTTTKRVCYVYKLVQRVAPGHYQSYFHPTIRAPQAGEDGETGLLYEYQLNEPSTSSMDTTPGLYCYLKPRACLRDDACLRCRIPAGTRVRLCRALGGYPALLVETLIPVEEVKQ